MIDLKKLQPEYLSITDIDILNSLSQDDFNTLAEMFKRKFNFLKIEIQQKVGRKSIQSGGYNHLRNHLALGNQVQVLEILKVEKNYFEMPIDNTKIELPTLKDITISRNENIEQSIEPTTTDDSNENIQVNDIDNKPKKGRKKSK